MINYIKNKLKKFYYYITWGSRNNNYDNKLDILGIFLENVKIISISTEYGFYILTFDDNSVLKFWEMNRWYGFMSHGVMSFSNGKTLSWYNTSPSYETLHKFKKFVLNFEKIEKSKEDDYYDCLPVKYLRKEKLKKIKK